MGKAVVRKPSKTIVFKRGILGSWDLALPGFDKSWAIHNSSSGHRHMKRVDVSQLFVMVNLASNGSFFGWCNSQF